MIEASCVELLSERWLSELNCFEVEDLFLAQGRTGVEVLVMSTKAVDCSSVKWFDYN